MIKYWARMREVNITAKRNAQWEMNRLPEVTQSGHH